MTMQEQFRALVQRNHARLVEQSAAVGRLLTRIEEGGAVSEALTEAQSITHQMKGAAGSIGFPDMGAAAAALDENLKGLRKQLGAISPDRLQTTLGLFAALERIAGETTPGMSTLYNADLSQLAR
jgi:HPt (histidine-containing phosphotransfer) domain-containing protein